MSAHPLDKARSMRRDAEDGFTLIELLVVVVILGILIAIAIPTYLSYRKSANDKAAQSDLRNAISTFEVCNSDTGYPTAATSAGVLTGCASQSNKVSISSGTVLTYFPDSATTPTAYIIEATNTGGSSPAKVYCYTSAAGGAVRSITANTVVAAYQAACPA
jgi:type IV pilus assembly protein PilA